MTNKGKINKKDASDKNQKDAFPKEIKDIIKLVPEEKKEDAIKKIMALSVRQESSFSGPLPPPSILKDYNATIKDGAERIMQMTENQSGHRIELEKHAIKEELKQSGRGQIYGFILALIGIAFTLAILGHDTVAGVFGTTTIVGLVTVFVIGKNKQTQDS